MKQANSILEKLGWNENMSCSAVSVPQEWGGFFSNHGFAANEIDESELVVVFLDDTDDIEDILGSILDQIDTDAILWTLIPKADGAISGDVVKGDLIEYFNDTNWIENDTLSGVDIDDDRAGYAWYLE